MEAQLLADGKYSKVRHCYYQHPYGGQHLFPVVGGTSYYILQAIPVGLL